MVPPIILRFESMRDTLKTDGACRFTSYCDRWPGHSSLAPARDELNRWKAVVYTHPTTAGRCRNVLPDVPAKEELGTGPTRTIIDIIVTAVDVRSRFAHFIFGDALHGMRLPKLIDGKKSHERACR